MDTSVGVIVGRFQVDRLHAGHLALIDTVRSRHRDVLICVGCTETRLTRINPLDFATRYCMLRERFPAVTIVPINDQPTDEQWSGLLDRTIWQAFPEKNAVLYGSRLHGYSVYSGRWNIVNVDAVPNASGTEIRAKIGERPGVSSDFRAGVIYGAQQRYPTCFHVVDVIVRDIPGSRILLIRKEWYPPGRWGLIGGFVSPDDESVEAAACREVQEETAVIIHNPSYLGSRLTEDWRYRNSGDAVMTLVLRADYVSGIPRAQDDVCAVSWFSTADALRCIVDHHAPLLALAFQ